MTFNSSHYPEPRAWAPPAELAQTLPRPIRRTAYGFFLALLALVAFGGALPVGFYLHQSDVKQVAETNRLRAAGDDAQGTVTSLEHVGKGHIPMVDYEFIAEGRQYLGRGRVTETEWSVLDASAPVDVRFVRSDPTINRPFGWDGRPNGPVLGFVVPFVLLVLGGVLYWNGARQQQLLAGGMPVAGTVTSCRSIRGGWSVGYEFAIPGGSRKTGRGTMNSPIDVGEGVCVLFDPRAPATNAPYPFDQYRIGS